MEAGKKSINDIFNGNRVLEIPFFQRAYVWDKPQWERFLEDMELITATKKPYFLGSVILKQQLTNASGAVGDVRTLIDGQQRLTTINIFFKVLCLKTQDNYPFTRTFKIKDNDLALLHNHNNINSFEKVLGLEKLEDVDGDDNIINAYRHFKKYIDINKIDYQSILNNVMFVGIDLGTDEDEQQIFDTINSLGVKLTTAELLKNYFFSRNDIKSYEKYWKNVFEADEDAKSYWDKEIVAGRLNRTIIDIFFYSYLQIKIQQEDLKIRREDKDEFSKIEILFDSYKKLFKNYSLNKENILLEIKEYATLFRNNFNLDIVVQELTNECSIERINAIIFGLENSTLISFTLYALRNIIDKDERNKVFAFIESYIMRRMVVKATSKNYNQLFTEQLISNKILSLQQLKDYINSKAEKVNYMPDDDELKKGFDESELINKQAAGVIYMIESRVRNRSKQSTQLLGISKYSLEHLMPKKWPNKWGSLTNKSDIEYRDFKLKTLGNLTIITQSLNASIRDSDWPTKVKGTDSNGLKHFSAGIETIASYLDLPVWNEAEISNRATFLYEKAKDLWKVD
jgi:uncharacterized protein with ParB-like and HNH nuclease domain